MKMIREQISEFASITGFIHEADRELGEDRTYPAILILPGGGFRFCSSREGEPIAAAYYAKGFQAFVLDYTTVTKKPDAVIEDPMKDVQLALEFLEARRTEYLMGSEKTALIGFSGGGHLAAASATHGPRRTDVILLIYPGIISSPLRALDCPDIIECVSEDTPPSFIIGSRDDLVTPPKHQLAFASALEQEDVDFELHIFPAGHHGMSLGTEVTSGGSDAGIDPVYAQWFDMSVRWMEDQFRGMKASNGKKSKYTLDMPIAKLAKSQNVLTIMREYVADIDERLQTPWAEVATLRGLNAHDARVLSKENMERIEELLQTV